MAQINCANEGCINGWEVMAISAFGGVLYGTLVCPRCQSHTVFDLRNNGARAQPGIPGTELQHVREQQVRDAFTEAITAYYGRAYRAAACMARASIETALKLKGIIPMEKGGKLVLRPMLEDYIVQAKRDGCLGNVQETTARGAQIIGNRALHEMQSVSPSQCHNALATTAELLNHIAQWRPSATQPRPRSNAPKP